MPSEQEVKYLDLDSSLLSSLVDYSPIMKEPLIISPDEIISRVRKLLKDSLAPTFVINAKMLTELNSAYMLCEKMLTETYMHSSRYDGFCSIGLCIYPDNTKIKDVVEVVSKVASENEDNFIAYFDILFIEREHELFNMYRLNLAKQALIPIRWLRKDELPDEIAASDVVIIPVVSVVRCILTYSDYGLIIGLLKVGIFSERLAEKLRSKGYSVRLVVTDKVDRVLGIREDPYFLAPLAICIQQP